MSNLNPRPAAMVYLTLKNGNMHPAFIVCHPGLDSSNVSIKIGNGDHTYGTQRSIIQHVMTKCGWDESHPYVAELKKVIVGLLNA